MTGPATASDIENMIQATGGVPVAIGGVGTYGHTERVSARQEPYDLSPAAGPQDAVIVPRGVLSADPTVDDPITVDGESLTVLDHREVEDGAQVVLVVGSWSHEVTIIRPTGDGSSSRGQQQRDYSDVRATGVGCDLWARGGEIRAEGFGEPSVGDWEARLPPGTDLLAGDLLKVTSGDGPTHFEVVFVGSRVSSRRLPAELLESEEEF